MKRTAILSACAALIGSSAIAQEKPPLPPLPPPQAIPRPAEDTGKPYAPQAILPGGVVVPLFAPDSPYLKADKLHVPEVYNMSGAVPGRISSIVSIHNASIEVHLAEKSINTGTAIIVIAGGGHRTLNVGGEAADFVPFFFNYGINTVILRNRLRADGYVAEVDAVRDAQQAVRVVRAYAKGWGIDPNRIGVMGFSAGAELAAPAAVLYEDFDKSNSDPKDPFAGISSRPDFAGIVYPGPTPFARNRTAPPIPKDVPPAFLVCGSAGDRGHAVWALDYYQAMLTAGVPNVELHLYGNGRHPGDPLPEGGRMSGGLTDRGGIPFGTWQYRFIDWARDLGFLQKPGVETKAAKDVAAFVANPPRPMGQGRGPAGSPAPPPATPGPATQGDRAQAVRRDIPYASPAHERQVLDVYAPPGAKGLPVVFWVHGGGWQTGDKTDVQLKPEAFTDRGFVFVSTGYRLLPHVEMGTIIGDIAKAIRWTHEHIAEYGGDPDRILVMGHSAGAQLAAIVCTDERYLKAEGVSPAILKGCVPVDGDTFDVPAIIETAETRRRVHGLPQATFGHREKFGNDPAKHRDFSAVTHVAKDRRIPPFLIMHVADHPDTSAQAQRLANALKEAGVPVRVYGARESTHNKLNNDIGRPDDPGTKALFEFVAEALKR